MRDRRRILFATLVLCGLGITAVIIIGMLDKQHRLNPEVFDGFAFALASPFAGVAAAAVWWRGHRWLPLVGLLVAAACLGLSLWGNLDAHLTWSRAKPGQEVMYFAGFIALIWCWALVLSFVTVGAICWGRRRWWQRAG